MHLDKVLNDTLVCTNAGIAVFLAHISLAVGFQQGIGEHTGTGGLKIITLLSGAVHHLIP